MVGSLHNCGQQGPGEIEFNQMVVLVFGGLLFLSGYCACFMGPIRSSHAQTTTACSRLAGADRIRERGGFSEQLGGCQVRAGNEEELFERRGQRAETGAHVGHVVLE